MFYKNIYKLFLKNPETPWNGTLKSAGTEIFHSTGQTEMGSETVLITMLFPKLIREMPLFWNSIFSKSSYKKKKKKFWSPIVAF